MYTYPSYKARCVAAGITRTEAASHAPRTHRARTPYAPCMRRATLLCAAVGPVEAAFPGSLSEDGSIDRARLSRQLNDDPDGFARLEAIVHPLVAEARQHFLDAARNDGADIAILDVPLLFETGGHEHVDAVIAVHAPHDVRRERVLQRPGMTEDKLAAIIARQTPDSVKLEKADYIVETSGGFDDARQQVGKIIAALRAS